AEQSAHRVGRGHRLETAAIPAAAYGTLGPDTDVTDLPSEARDPAVEPPVDHDPCADPGRDHDVDHVRHSAARAERHLRERPQIRVVVDRDLEVAPPDRGARPPRGPPPRVPPPPAGEGDRPPGRAPPGPRAPPARPPHRRRAPARPPPRPAPRQRGRPPRRAPPRQPGRRRGPAT